MIRAVCFSADVFRKEVLERILDATGATWGGWMAEDIQPNCLESFPDGSMYYSCCTDGVPDKVVNCHSDVGRFIYVNGYGKKNTDTAV